MPEPGTDFEGYVRARLEDISRVQTEQRGDLLNLRVAVASLAVALGALKATARAWGTFAGVISGMFSAVAASVASRLWRP